MEILDEQAEETLRELVHEDPLVWWEGFVQIENKQHELVQAEANVLQQKIGEYVRYCREHRIPMRVVVPKPRSKGISTITVAIMQWMQKLRPLDGLIVGGKDWQVDNLWAINKRYAETDTFPWGFSAYVMDTRASFGNGSKTLRQTAGGKDPGRSAVIQLLLGTEVAYWGHDKSVKSASAVLTGLLACVPYDPDTLVVLESTSSGGSGLFFRKCEESIPLEMFLAGERSADNFVKIFAGWHEFPDSVIPVADAKEEREVLAGVGARNEVERQRERQMRARFGLSAGQIKYWRKLLKDCDNDPDKRDREYPTEIEDCFRAAQPCRFNRTMLLQMRDQARLAAQKLQYGLLEQPDALQKTRYQWRPVIDPLEANFIIHEHPKRGARYTMAIDNAGGRATGDDKSDTDCHAILVLRDGYIDGENRRWVPPAVVATILPKQRVDTDIMAEWAWRLSCYYGQCLIVPEANNDRGAIGLLRARGARIYQQERPATQVDSHKPSGKYGFWTRGGENEGTRRYIIELLARAVRELGQEGEGLFVPFLFILEEMEHFCTDPDTGKDEAMGGWHDDWVMALAIALGCRSGSTIYIPPAEVVTEVPRDLQLLGNRGGKGGSGADRV